MSIFDRPVLQLTQQDLADLLADSAVENARLEFKSVVPDKDESLKKLSSFANTFGGYLVIGAEANSKDGRLIGFPGVDIQNGYKQKIVDWCFAGVYPPLMVEVSAPVPSPENNGKHCYVLRILESDVAPHFLNGRKGVWVRTDEYSSRFEARLANESELRLLFNRRQLIVGRRASLFSRSLGRFQQLIQPEGKGAAPRMELSIGPRFPAQPLCTPERLHSIIGEQTIAWRKIGFPVRSNGMLSHHESAIIPQPASGRSILEATVWGTLFYAMLIAENRGGEIGIHLGKFVGSLLVFLRHAAAALAALGYAGPVEIELNLKFIRNLPWLFFSRDGIAMNGPSAQLDDHVEFSVESTTEALTQGRDLIAKELLRGALLATNWANAANSAEILDADIRSGHDYNLW